MNFHAMKAIYVFEMARTFRTIVQSIVSPVISTCLYFVVFGTAIGSRIEQVDGVPYGSFIVPGLIMLSVLMQSLTNAAFGIYFPKFMGTMFNRVVREIGEEKITVEKQAFRLRKEMRRADKKTRKGMGLLNLLRLGRMGRKL